MLIIIGRRVGGNLYIKRPQRNLTNICGILDDVFRNTLFGMLLVTGRNVTRRPIHIALNDGWLLIGYPQ